MPSPRKSRGGPTKSGILTLGIFWIVINALMLWLATAFVPGFHISGFVAAFVGAIVLMLVNMLFRALLPKRRDQY